MGFYIFNNQIQIIYNSASRRVLSELVSLYFKMNQQALALWKSQVPSYEKIIARCCSRILTPLTKFLPSDFQQRVNQFREILLMREPESYEPYIQIIVQHIQGQKNRSIIQLADSLVSQFGGNLKYWQNIILDLAQQVIYTPELSIWHIRKVFQQKLCADPQNLSNFRRLCKLTKTYLTALVNLIKYITKFDTKKDTIAKVDQLFKKVKSAEEKYVGFSEQIVGLGLEHSITFDEVSNNISQKSKQNALKGLFHFKDNTRQQRNQKTRNTLFKYNFKVKSKQIDQRVSGPTKNVKDTNKQLTGEPLEKFENILKNLKSDNNTNIQELQDQFKTKNKQQNADQDRLKYPTNFTTIWDKDYYFTYAMHPIQAQKFNSFTEPFAKLEWVNYQINSDDEYQDLIGEDVDNNSEISSVSEVSKNSFVVSDGHYSDDEDAGVGKDEIKPQISSYFGDRWSFSKDTVFNNRNCYKMVLIEPKAKTPLQTSEKNETQQALYRIIDGKDKLSITDALSKQKIKISKAKLKQFLDKKCKLVIISQNPYKSIYRIIGNEEDNNDVNQKQNISRKSYQYTPDDDELNQKQEQQDTGMYQQQFLSQPCLERRVTRGSKKQQSQKIGNASQDEIKRRSSRDRKSSKLTNKNQKKTV